ncbi:MAG: site-2 protease family protein [candidate division WOR-3 bacterium]|nr:MAG: site-2 protease family protein [candidate division WOR-3 bacterium]
MNGMLGLIISLPAILIVITVHEYFHGYVAYLLGDPTAKFAGRLTLNPIKHIDIFGFLAFLFLRFGWAKPVPINPYNFRDMKKGMLYTSISGPASNFLFAIPLGLLLRLFPPLLRESFLLPLGGIIGFALFYSLVLCAFNLIPIPPLDGSKALFSLLPPRYAHVEYWLERYGFMLLIGLIMFDRITGIPILWGWIGPFVDIFARLFAGTPAFAAFIHNFLI